MRNLELIYGSIIILGIAFLAIFLPPTIFFSSLGDFFLWSKFSSLWLFSTCFFSIIGAIFITTGSYGIGSRYFKISQKLFGPQPNRTLDQKVKHSKFFLFIVVLGGALLAMFPVIGYIQ